MNSIWIQYLIRAFNMNSLSRSRIHYLVREFCEFALFSRVFVDCFCKFKLNQLESTIDMAYSLWILYSFCECIINSKSVSFIHLESTICFSESLLIHYLFREFPMNSLSFSWNHNEFTNSSTKSLSVSRIYFVFTINSTIYLEILYLFREITINLESLSGIYCDFIIHYRFLDLTLNQVHVCLSRNHYEFVKKIVN